MTLVIGMASSLKLPSWSASASPSANASLRARLAQIEQQRGAFRYVTEASLQEGAPIHETVLLDESEDEDGDAEDTPEQRQEKVWKAREEMLKQLDRAKNETLHALDFISFLLSKHSAAAQTSMSPFLQQSVPVGVLDGHKIEVARPPKASQRRLLAVQRGLRTQSYAEAGDKLAAAGSRLHRDASLESSFWDQLAQIQSQGWSISRLPRDSKAIGVHFGFAEASPRFRTRGFAILKQAPDGRLHLDPAAGINVTLAVRVTILRNGQATGHSEVLSQRTPDRGTIGEEIEQARNRLFDEELFYELGREGRVVANQGVVVSATAIKVPIGADLEIQIEHVDPEDDQVQRVEPEDDQVQRVDASDNLLANSVATSLRLLLTHAHARNRARRSQPPGPISLQPKITPEYALLRPLMSHLQHASAIAALQSFSTAMEQLLQNAGLRLTSVGVNSWHGEPIAANMAAEIIKYLLEPVETTISLTLPTDAVLTVKVRSHAGAPIYGTEYTITTPTYSFARSKTFKVTDLAELKTHLFLGLVADILAVAESKKTEDAAEKSSSWRVTNAPHGEMSLDSGGQGVASISIHISHDRLGLRCKTKHRANAKTSVWVWSRDQFKRTPAASSQETGSRHLPAILDQLMAEVDSNPRAH